jgi:hypothetical protein
MKKVIRLTESDLIKLVNKVIKEEVKESYIHAPSDWRMDLINKYGVHISQSGEIFKDGDMIGKIKEKMIPSGMYYVEDKFKRELDLKDSFEEALRSLLGE